MRTRLVLTTTALVLASLGMAFAQDPPTKPPAPTTPQVGVFDFGFRGTNYDGDAARYERYRDLQNGAATYFTMKKDTSQYKFDLLAQNIGYTDQRYAASYYTSKTNLKFLWDSIPTNYAYYTLTPWVDQGNGVLTLDDSAQQQVQNKTAVGVPCAPGGAPAACNNPTTVAAAIANRSIYNNLSPGFEMKLRRDTANVDLTYAASETVGVNIGFTSTGRTGTQPWAAAFAFNNANILPLPLDQRTNDFTAGLEWANQTGLIRVAYDGSFFNNQIQSLTWDNPIRFTDTTPYDPSGYSNGNGPARGQMALAPSNTLNAVGVTGLYKLPSHTVVNGMLRVTEMASNESLLPWTTNSAINNPTVLAQFPGLAQLPRATAEAKVQGLNGLLNLNSRPNKYVGFMVRYRYNKHDNQTPHFNGEEYVRFDAVPEETGGETEQFDITSDTLDATATFNLGSVAVRTGYGYDAFVRSGRSFANMNDRRFRLSVDTLQTQYLTIRAGYDYTERRGQGFSESAIEDGGSQPGVRFYDEADRDSHRTNIVFILSPLPMLDLSANFGTSREKYMGEGHEFGLLNADVNDWTLGVTLTPSDYLEFGGQYGRNTYSTFQKSRNANPPPDPTWTDPTRDWTLDNDEAVNSANAYVDITNLYKGGELRVNYDYDDSDNAYGLGGPRVDSLAAARQFLPLPNVTSKWQRFTIDYKVYLANNVGLGFGYWYEKQDMSDFATIDANGPVEFYAATGTPRLDWLGGLMTGYGNRPYKGQTGFVRILYRF